MERNDIQVETCKTSPEENTFRIYEGNMERLNKAMARIQKKCAKHGCDFRFETVGEEYGEIQSESGPRLARYILVRAEGIAICNGWQFVATLEHTTEGNIIRGVAGIEVPERFYDCPAVCEHCGTNRARKNTYIIQNTETGEFKQVGRQCLKEYTHGMDAGFVAGCFEAMDLLKEGDAPRPGCQGETYYDRDMMLRCAAEAVRAYGYVKCGHPNATRGVAERFYLCDQYSESLPPDFTTDTRREMKDSDIQIHSDRARSDVADALAWLDTQKATGGYIHNLKTVMAMEYTSEGNLNLLVSLFGAWEKAKHDEAEKKAHQWVGEIGKRIEFRIMDYQILGTWQTFYGSKSLYKIFDEEGNIFLWRSATGLYQGDIGCVCRATLTDHTEYKGIRENVVTRCMVR